MTALVLLCWLAAADGGDGGPRLAPDGGAPPDARADAGAPEAGPAPVPRVRVRGRVVAKGTREPLVGAGLTLDAAPAGETDEAGRFELLVTPGRHRLQVQHPGHEPATLEVDAREGEAERTVRLAPRLLAERYETVVTRPDERAARTTLRDEELQRVPGSFGDPFRVVESLPGVAQVLWPLAIYAIRGANPGNTGFFLDGVRIPALFHFALGPSVIHPFFLEQLDFYPGGYPARFGRFVSGMVSARTANPAADRLHASGDVRLFDAGGIVAAPISGGAGAVAVAGRLSYTGLLFSAFSSDVAFNYWDYQARLDHALGPGRLTMFVFGSSDFLSVTGSEYFIDAPLDPNEKAGAELSFHRLDLRWDGAFAGGRLESGLVFGRNASATSIRSITALPISSRMYEVAPRLFWRRGLASWLELETGGDLEAQRFRPRSEHPEAAERDLFRDRDALSAGGFVGLVARAGDRLIVAPGFRVDGFREQGVTVFEPGPRLNVRVRPVGQVWLKATAGRYAQMASLPVSVPGFEGFGLADFGAQTSIQTSLGVEAPLPGELGLDLTGFYQRLRLTDLESQFALEPSDRTLLELRDGQSYGVELLLRRQIGQRLHGWLAYTLSKSERLVGYYRTRAPSDWDQRHILNLVLGYRLPRGWTAGTRLHYNTGRPYPVVDVVTAQVDYERLPDFHQLDLRVDKRLVFDRFVMDVYLEVVNAMQTREEYDRRRNNGVLERRSFKIALPSIGVHAEW